MWQRLDCHGQKQTFGFVPQGVSDDSHLRKLTTWIYSHGVFHGDLSCNCQGDHVHAPKACRNTCVAGVYTHEFCRAMMDCYEPETVPSCWTSFPAIGDGFHCGAHAWDITSQGFGDYMEDSSINMEPHELHDRVHGGDPHASHGEYVGDDHPQIDSLCKECLAENLCHLHVGKRAAQILSRWKRHRGQLRPPEHARRLCLAGIGVEVHELLAEPLSSETLRNDAVRGIVPDSFSDDSQTFFWLDLLG